MDKSIFKGVTMRNNIPQNVTQDENRLYLKLVGKAQRSRYQFINAKSELIKTITDLQSDETLMVLSNKVDMPNIVKIFAPKIRNVYLASFGFTRSGFSAIYNVANNGICEECVVLLSQVHHYDWWFYGDSYKLVQDKMRFKFAVTHAKLAAMEFADGTYLNFSGSANFNNIRNYENVVFDRRQQTTYFIRNFINDVEGTWR